MNEFGPTVSRLQSKAQDLQEETETFQRAAGELREQRDSLQRRVDETDRELAQRREALNQFQFKLKSQGLLIEDCEMRAKEAERENAAVQAELDSLRAAIAEEKRHRLERLDGADGRVQGLVRQFREAASLTNAGAAITDGQTEAARRRVGELRGQVGELASRLEAEKQDHLVSQEVKTATLADAQACVDGLKEQLGL